MRIMSSIINIIILRIIVCLLLISGLPEIPSWVNLRLQVVEDRVEKKDAQ